MTSLTEDCPLVDDCSLLASIAQLNDTATSLAALVGTVNKNQELLVKNQELTLENTDAISLRSTKKELLKEVDRLANDRQRDRKRTIFTIAGALLVSIVLIGATMLTTKEFISARHDANVAYSEAAKIVCLQRNETWDSMEEWAVKQRDLMKNDPSISLSRKAKEIASYTALINAMPVVDCDIASKLVGLPPPKGLTSTSTNDLALTIFKDGH